MLHFVVQSQVCYIRGSGIVLEVVNKHHNIMLWSAWLTIVLLHCVVQQIQYDK